jgi:HEAT repeat protein
MREMLRSEDPLARNAVLLALREVKDNRVAQALNLELASAPASLQELVLMALGDCHNAGSVQAVDSFAKTGAPSLRGIAMASLGRMGPPAVPALLSALERDSTTRDAASRALRSMPGSEVDSQVLTALASASNPALRLELIRIIDSRGPINSSGELLRQAASSEPEVALAALSALSSLGRPEQAPALMQLAEAAPGHLREGIESALMGLCSRSDEAAALITKALATETSSQTRASWIRVMAGVGYPKALPLIEAAAKSADPGIAEVAVTQLGRWPDPAPVPGLLEITRSGAAPGTRKAAARAVLDLCAAAADEKLTPDSQLTTWLEQVREQPLTLEDQKRFFGVLGRIKTLGSYRMLAAGLENSEVKVEAAAGLVQVAPALTKSTPAAELRVGLSKVAENVENPELRERARKLLRGLNETPRQP